MKFKRLAAFVLTAALSVSSAGISVFAAEVTMKDSVEPYEKVMTIKFNHDFSSTTFDTGNNSYPKADDGNDDLNKMVSNWNPGSPSGGTLYKFLGWTTDKITSNDEYDKFTTDKAALDEHKVISRSKTRLGDLVNNKATGTDGISLTGLTVQGTAVGKDSISKGDTIILYPLFRRWKSQNQIDDEAAEKAAEAKANDDATRWINKRNNVVGNLQKKNEITKNNAHKLPTTEDPKGKIETKQVSVSPKNNHGADGVNTSTYNYSPTDMKNIKDYLKIADTDLYFVYDAEYPSGYELIPGKQAIVTFNVRYDKDADGNKDGAGNNLTSKELNYDLTDSRVYLYRITQTGKVKVTDITKGKNYVSTITDQFGLYILVVAPKGATVMGYENPPTGEGDVLPVAMLAVSAIGASCLLTVRKRKEVEA